MRVATSPRKRREDGIMRSKFLLLLLVVALLVSVSPSAQAADPVVLRVIVVQTDDMTGYLKEIENAKAINKRLSGSSTVRVWKARFAGDEAGSVVVSIEYPSLMAMAQDEQKSQADPEYKALLGRLDKMRKIVSDSLYNELKP